MTEELASLKHLFQKEFSRMVAVISRRFGLTHIEAAEDIVSETFLQAAENWGMKGMPPNPTAWLYAVAKQKALEQFRRQKIFENTVLPELQSREALEDDQLNFSEEHIRDSQLQMMFAVCTPAIASEAQIALALRILCGFGIDEIAEAFFTSKETINKRLHRAKEKLRAEQVPMELPPEEEIDARLDTVLHIIYLLFSEGYYSKTQDQILRKDLCAEALRLGVMLTEYERTDLPKTNALVALMCFPRLPVSGAAGARGRADSLRSTERCPVGHGTHPSRPALPGPVAPRGYGQFVPSGSENRVLALHQRGYEREMGRHFSVV